MRTERHVTHELAAVTLAKAPQLFPLAEGVQLALIDVRTVSKARLVQDLLDVALHVVGN
eukprot:COSAG01_NODE_72649_length_252_cov_0.993464_1_plen_58_part_10